jgi:hypothetical protein
MEMQVEERKWGGVARALMQVRAWATTAMALNHSHCIANIHSGSGRQQQEMVAYDA